MSTTTPGPLQQTSATFVGMPTFPQAARAALAAADRVLARCDQRSRQPENGVFFASLLPQFMPPGEATFSALLFLGLTFSLMTFT